MVNYQNGKIYKIINTENNEIVYIGSTTQPLCKRYSDHIHKAPNHKIILIENYACNSKEELCMKEQEIIEEHTNLLNKQKAYRSEEELKEYNKEYRQNNKEYYKEKNKEHYKKNKNKIKEYNKDYREKNREYLNKKHKDFYENNREYFNEWYKNNKEKRQEKINCEFCNCLITKPNIKQHQKSIKCMKFQFIEG